MYSSENSKAFYNPRCGTTIATGTRTARTRRERRTGLLGRQSFDAGEALWIIPCWSIHTIGMKFSIDVLFLSRDSQVLGLRQRLKPWRLGLCWNAHSVLELPPGAIAASGTRRGDFLTTSPPASEA